MHVDPLNSEEAPKFVGWCIAEEFQIRCAALKGRKSGTTCHSCTPRRHPLALRSRWALSSRAPTGILTSMADYNYYELLKLEHSATAEEIKAAYLRLSKLVHPDRGGSEALFGQVNRAYEILSDPARREIYDRNGRVDKETQSSDTSAPGWRRTDDKPPKEPGPEAKPKSDPTSSSYDESSDEPPPPRSPPPPTQPPPARDPSATSGVGATGVTNSALRKHVATNPSWALLAAGVLIISFGGTTFLFLGLIAVVAGFVGVLGRKKAAHRSGINNPGPARTGGSLLADELKAGAPTVFKGALAVFLGVLAGAASGSKSGRKRKRRR